MNNLVELKVKNYRGFINEQCVKFAQPNGKNGSGLTVIVGPNNSGKTSIIEALTITTNKKIAKGERYLNADPEITISTSLSKTVFTNIANGSQIQTKNELGLQSQHGLRFEMITSRRYWQAESGGESTPENFVSQTSNHSLRGNSQQADVAALLRSINKNEEKKFAFTELIRKINRNFFSWTIDTDDNGVDYVKYITKDGYEHRANFLGDGLISIMRICAHFFADQKSLILVVDEPELSLHPNAQKKLARFFSELSKDRQVILCTHSPHFVNFGDYINGAEIVRLNKTNDKECLVSQVSRGHESRLSGLIEDWHKPALLDYVAKELLFYERVLFVEGQEDVSLIKSFFNEQNKILDFEIFGYGVGGCGNMEFFISLAKDLKLEKVAVLFDANVHNFDDLKRIYGNKNTKFFQLETEDIRDKKGCADTSCTQKTRIGTFKENGKLKRDHSAKKFYFLMKQVRRFLSQKT
jgi:predicted ATP-dependent endonuclease of OLD family